MFGSASFRDIGSWFHICIVQEAGCVLVHSKDETAHKTSSAARYGKLVEKPSRKSLHGKWR